MTENTPHKKNVNATGESSKSVIVEENSLHENEMLQNYIDMARVILIAYNSDCEITMINNEGIEIVGYSEKELIGKNWIKLLVCELQKDNCLNVFKKIVSGEIRESEEYECTIITKNGNEKNILWYSNLIKDENGNIVGIFSTGEDITEKAKAIKQVKESEEKYRMLVETMDEGVMIVDTKGIIQFVNRKNCEIMGYTSEQMVGKSASELLLEGQFKPYIEKVMNERDEGDSGQYEIPIKTGRGETRWLLINGCPMFDHNGNNIGSIGIHTDITIRKNIENELINAKNKVEETSRIKEVFFANMSHEIRTPMNGIVGITKLLAKTTLSPKQKLYLNAIQDSAKNLLVIIGDILDFSKMEAGKIQLNTERFNFHKLIDNVVQIFSYRASEKSLSLIKKISKDVPKYLIGDPVRINQILTNLVGNAIKFTNSGQVEIKVHSENISDEEIKLKFDISDTGIGIPENMRTKIFESFVQANAGIHGRFGGTGLGLPIVKKLVDMHGGIITINSRERIGTTFSFELILKKDSDISDIEQDKELIEEKPLKISVLVAEDNLINQLVVTEILKQWNCKCDVVDNGIKAIDKVKENSYDIILMDIQMPEMNGLDATAYIRNQMEKEKSSIPIIALTAHATQKEKEQSYAVGINDYIIKPFERNDLYKKILKQINGNNFSENGSG